MLAMKIDGKVYVVSCAECDAAALQQRFHVTGISRDEVSGGVQLRILCDREPEVNSTRVATSLEDYYLSVFGEQTILI